MKFIKDESYPNGSIVKYLTYGAVYGKVIFTDREKYKNKAKDYYFVGLRLSPLDIAFTMYKGEQKPKFKHLGLLTALFTIPCILAWVVQQLTIVFILFTTFYKQCLFRESFITVWYERVSGYIALAFSLIGLFATIKFFFF